MANIVVYFDMDRTLLSQSSGMLYIRYLWRRGQVSALALLRSYWYALLYKLHFFDYPSVTAKLASSVSSDSEAETRALCERWFRELGVNYVAPKAVQRLNEHRQQGHLVAIISASTPYVVAPLAAHVGVEEYLCTRLEVVDGRFTGRIIEPACYGMGKVHWAEQFATEHGARLGDSYFYSDSHTDLPLLESVGHPVAVNPDRALRATAVQRGWPLEQFY